MVGKLQCSRIICLEMATSTNYREEIPFDIPLSDKVLPDDFELWFKSKPIS